MQLWHVLFDWLDNDDAPQVFTFTSKTGALGKVKRLYAEVNERAPKLPEPSTKWGDQRYDLDDNTWCFVVSSELGRTKEMVGLE